MTQTAKLQASNGEPGDAFGSSVAIADDTVVVGVPCATVPDAMLPMDGGYCAGRAYVFVEPTLGWSDIATHIITQTAELGEWFVERGDWFGASVAISDDTVVVGAPGAATPHNQGQWFSLGPGTAYVFVKPASGWADTTDATMLVASDGMGCDEFGCAVAISGDTVVVGEANANCPISGGYGPGAAYVFVEPAGGWPDNSAEAWDLDALAYTRQTAKLTASDGVDYDGFGCAVAISADTVVVGVPGEGAGAAYVFVKPAAGWSNMHQTGKLLASDGQDGDGFACSVAIDGGTVVAGRPGSEQRPAPWVITPAAAARPTCSASPGTTGPS